MNANKRIRVTKTTEQKVLTKKVQFKRSKTVGISATSLVFHIGQKFKSVKEMAATFGANVLPRRGFGYIGKNTSHADVAVWTVNIDKNQYWYNRITDNGDTLIESKAKGESRTEYLNRIRKDLDYDAKQRRLTFAKTKNRLYFIGVFLLSEFNVDSQTTIYKRVADKALIVHYKRMTRTLTLTIEETEEEAKGIVFI